MIAGKVNIVIPLFNQEEFVKQCVESALNQTYGTQPILTTQMFDVTVVNDGSTDHSRVVVEEMRAKWNDEERLKYVEYFKENKLEEPNPGCYDFCGKLKIIDQENKGLSTSRNIGIRAGDGEFILPLDSDDWIEPNYLERTVPQMLANANVGIVSTDMQYEGLLHSRIPPKGLSLAHEMVSNDLPVCSLIRRKAFEQTPGYETLFIDVAGSTKVLGYEDWNMWIDILKRGWQVAVVNEPLFHYRVKPVSMITQATKVHAGLVRLIHLLHPDLWKGE